MDGPGDWVCFYFPATDGYASTRMNANKIMKANGSSCRTWEQYKILIPV